MNIFLVGNGLDLHFGLPTKYSNFLNFMKYLKNKGCIENICTDKPISQFFENAELIKIDEDFERFYNKHRIACNNIFIEREEYQFLFAGLNNHWLKYFLLSLDKEKTWIDLEKEISYVLKCFDKFCVTEGQDSVSHYIVKSFGMIFNDENKENFFKEFPKGSGNKIFNKEKMIKQLSLELDEFTKLLKIYIRHFADDILTNVNREEINIDDPAFLKADYAVNFNYTNTFEKLYELNKDKVFHLHGNVNDEIILGINPDSKDELNGLDTTFIQFKKYYQRIVNRTDVDYQNFIKNIDIFYSQSPNLSNTNNFIVIVAGHSLDKTDEDIIKQVFRLADKIIILCHNDQAIGNYIKKLITIYGKKEFDNLRSETDLEFTSYENLNNILL